LKIKPTKKQEGNSAAGAGGILIVATYIIGKLIKANHFILVNLLDTVQLITGEIAPRRNPKRSGQYFEFAPNNLLAPEKYQHN
jgi:hypothetical protein